MRVRSFIAGLLVVVPLAGTGVSTARVSAAGSTRVTLHNTRTFWLAAGDTKTFEVPYPDALKYGASTYSGNVRILAPAKTAHGTEPSLKQVIVLTRGSCIGGSDLCAKVRNANKPGTAPTRLQITATTRLPPGKKR